MTHQHQLSLFRLNPENLFAERETHDDNVAFSFDTDCGTTLNGLLGAGGGGSTLSSEEDSLSPSVTYTYEGQDSDEGASSLVRTALRHQGRKASEEKWVVYSEVVEKKEEEVTSSGAKGFWYRNQPQGLSLKLDYQEILNAWSDKGPLYIEEECPQSVPAINKDSSLVRNAQLQRVPDEGGNRVEGGGGEGTKKGQREARVLRYKIKRQSRLFSKRSDTKLGSSTLRSGLE